MNLASAAITRDQIVSTIATAAKATGVDFDYLLRTAMRESSLKTEAKSNTSTASGLFQFIEQTWLGVLHRHGEKHGLEGLSQAIERDANGRYRVADRSQRQAILALRHDPAAAAAMAGELTRESAEALERGLGRKPKTSELYVAHFLGAGGATALIRASEEQPWRLADEMFPAAAEANRRIFYDADGNARTVREVYANLTRLPEVNIEDGMARGHQGMAASGPAAPLTAMPARPTARSAMAGGMGAIAGYAAGMTAGGVSGDPFGLRAGGRGPLVLTPQVIEILATLDPLSVRSDDRRRAVNPLLENRYEPSTDRAGRA